VSKGGPKLDVCVSHVVSCCQITRKESDGSCLHSEISFHRLVGYFCRSFIIFYNRVRSVV
jgi:hypothetical protein